MKLCSCILLILLLPILSMGQSAYDKSPVYFDVGVGLLPIESFSIELGGTVGYRLTDRLGIGLGYLFTAVNDAESQQVEAHGLIAQLSYELPKHFFVTAQIGKVMGGTYSDVGRSNAFIISSSSSFLFFNATEYEKGGFIGGLQVGRRTRSGITLGGYLNVISPMEFRRETFNFGTVNDATFFNAGLLGGGFRLGYFFPRNLNRK